MQSDRRSFLKTCAATAAYLAVPTSSLLWARAASETKMWVTSKDKRAEASPGPQWHDVGGGSFTGIDIDPGKSYQQILGFGAPFTDASCYLFGSMEARQRDALLSELFGPTGLRFSVARTCIGASDYS